MSKSIADTFQIIQQKSGKKLHQGKGSDHPIWYDCQAVSFCRKMAEGLQVQAQRKEPGVIDCQWNSSIDPEQQEHV